MNQEKEAAVKVQKFEKADKIRDEVNKLKEELEEEKNKWKQKSSNLPLGIKAKVGLAVKVGAVALGFHVWGIDFIWVVLGFTFCYDILRGIFSCLVSLVALIGFFYFLFTHIF